ncbi:MAG: ATP-dependent sacrificial sulfur transferase LarE [Anaerolineales bacterium]|nr:ATP-dependent sacrificial sulfur transferase LarE [Anaerolineales bacterium]
MISLQNKLDRLRQTLSGINRAAIAFSGGVDSTFLLWATLDVLGSERVIALTASSPIIFSQELKEAGEIANELGARHMVVPTGQMEDPQFIQNPADRCYLCKREILTRLRDRAQQEGFPVLLEGSNWDDQSEYRPGMRAVKELNVRSPLEEAGLGKAEIRVLSRQVNLPTWNKPAQTCLATRFPHGSVITMQGLEQVDRAEALLRDLGFQPVRVRHHGAIARIEAAPEDLARLVQPEIAQKVTVGLRALGFSFIVLDMEGYRRGSLEPDRIITERVIDAGI